MERITIDQAERFDAVETFRKIKEDLSEKMYDMSFEELKAFLQQPEKTECVNEKRG